MFESYPPASYKVRNDYSNILKTENYINPLLDFLFDALGHSTANAINLDKARYDPTKIRNYNIWEAVDTEPEEQQMQWLMINVYFLALKYTPNLVKNWWVDCPSKQTRIAVEAWTAKYFSPLVIQDTLEEVSQWASEQETTSEDEKELIVKVSKRSREVLAGYEIDELMMQIAVRLPANYPLEGVKVEGVNRVAVSEKKWTSWLMITQGVVTFSVSPSLCQLPSLLFPRLTSWHSERLTHRWPYNFPQERHWRTQRPDRMRHLLFDYLLRQKDAREALPDLQELIPFRLLVQVVRK